MKISSYLCTVLVSVLLSCSALRKYDDTKFKTALVEEIIQKVCNITLDSFTNAASEEKNKLMSKIEDKLKKSAKSLGPHGDKYVKTIMHGVKIMAFNNSKPNDTLPIKNTLRGNNESNEIQRNEPKTKEQLIKDIANKVELLAKEYFNDAKTHEDTQKVMEKIKKRVIESAKRKHTMLHNKHDEIKAYSNLIAQGIELMMRRNTSNNTRRMDLEFIDNINANKVAGEDNEYSELINTKDVDISSNMNNLDKNTIEITYNHHKPIMPNSFTEFTPKSSCDEVKEVTCSNLKSLNKLKCSSDETELYLEKLCDGIVDCSDTSDEQNCAIQAVDRVRSARRIMSDIESSLVRKCFIQHVDNALLIRQNEVLRNVLQSELNFIQKHAEITSSPLVRVSSREFINTLTLRKTVNELALVLSTLALSLEGALCSPGLSQDKAEDTARKYSDIVDKDLDTELREATTWSSKSCVCNGQLCSASVCSNECKRVCWQKYSLNRWQCQAVNGETSVSLDLICDGKLDCYDETDENDCATGAGLAKFEASDIYNNILKMLLTKTSSKEYESVRSKLQSLHASVNRLQKLSIKLSADVLTIKSIREQCFTQLTSIYEEILNNAPFIDEVYDVYLFLLSLNEKLVGAMKLSHTGNDKIISPDGCFCRDGKCALPRCSKMCIRFCTAEPKLTRYFCGGDSSNNNSVPVDAICNGKLNCPEGNDEEDCKKEVCRRHHLVVLRNNIRDVGDRQRGTALGEALRTWKTLVTATLRIAENNDRPTLRVLKDIVNDILHDLVTTYANLDDFRRSNNDHIFREFSKLSQLIIETIKSCGK